MHLISFPFKSQTARKTLCFALSFCLPVSSCEELQEQNLLPTHFSFPDEHHRFPVSSTLSSSELILPILKPLPVHSLDSEGNGIFFSRLLAATTSATGETSTAVPTSENQLEIIQDKWLADRLVDSVNWSRLAVDAAAFSRALETAAETDPHGQHSRGQPVGPPGGPPPKSDVVLDLLKRSEMFADNIDQLLGMLNGLEREASREGIGFSPNGWNLVMSVEQTLSAAGTFAETLDDVASTDRTVAARGSELLPIIAQRLSSALNSFGSDSASQRLGEAIGRQRLAPLLQAPLLRHIAADGSNNRRKVSDRRTGVAATTEVAAGRR